MREWWKGWKAMSDRYTCMQYNCIMYKWPKHAKTWVIAPYQGMIIIPIP